MAVRAVSVMVQGGGRRALFKGNDAASSRRDWGNTLEAAGQDCVLPDPYLLYYDRQFPSSIRRYLVTSAGCIQEMNNLSRLCGTIRPLSSSFFVFCYLTKHKDIFSSLNLLQLCCGRSEGSECNVNTLSPAKGGSICAASDELNQLCRHIVGYKCSSDIILRLCR